MKKIIAVVDFSWAHRGVEVVEYPAGALIETDDEDLIAVAEREGWANKDGKAKKSKSAAEVTPPAGPSLDPAQNDTTSQPPIPEPTGQ